MEKKIKIFAPASSANLGSGFDVIGLAISTVGDILEIRENALKVLRIFDNSQMELPEDINKNVATVSAQHLLNHIGIDQGFDFIFHEKIYPGSGLGSSAASAVAAVWGINCLLGKPLEKKDLVYYATLGEKVASGTFHADNIAPAMLGGVQFIRNNDPLKIISLPYPNNLHCIIILPKLKIETKESRSILPKKVKLKKVVKQTANLGSLIYGFMTKNMQVIGESMQDALIEPYRIPALPAFKQLKKMAVDHGAKGVCISGSGPSVFAIVDNINTAHQIGEKCSTIYKEMHIQHEILISRIDKKGVRMIT